MNGLTTGFADPPARCPAGHETRPGSYLYGWQPCGTCLPLRGHRELRCKQCIDAGAETVILDPPCPAVSACQACAEG